MLTSPLLVTRLTSDEQKLIGEKTSKNLALALEIEGFGFSYTPDPVPVESVGWVRNKRVDCPFSLGLFICHICIRSGFDLRYHFCPIGKAPQPDQGDLP